MKKTIAYILVLVLSIAVLTGCSANGTMDFAENGNDDGTVSASPAVVTPDPHDGVVQDEDGIITDDDTGSLATPDTEMQHRGTENTTGKATSSAQPAGTPNGNTAGSRNSDNSAGKK